MSNTADWGMVESFHIDNGELDGLSLHQAFVLGVEWQMVYEKLQSGKGFRQAIRAENEQRICALLERNGREFACICSHDDWRDLRVSR